MEHRLHPWMSHDIREQVKELELESGQSRRKTLAVNQNIAGGHRPTEKNSFKGNREDGDNVDLDEF